MGLEFGHLGDDILEVLHQHALGQFQLEALGVGSGAIKGRQHLFDELRLAELQGADVDREGETGCLFPAGPRRDLLAGGFQDPISQGQDQPGFLGQGNELVRRYDAAAGVLPTDQGLGAGQAAAFDLRLVVKQELFFLDCVAEDPPPARRGH